ncbi:hypothetical protein IFR04_005262 [Cadophora malorum]|uniref:Uncharacterized protein n=1 Tax=Cadophora malorum TaxID=108018 RepID=A0A8H7TMQ8_9HELO|nr:hypothetical protein IFR04_005262 [Cadophora malorum]
MLVNSLNAPAANALKADDATPEHSTTYSQGLNAFLTELSGAYSSNHTTAIHDAQTSLIGALKTEKKIKKKRGEVKKDNEFIKLFDKTLHVKDGGKAEVEMEIEIKGGGDEN